MLVKHYRYVRKKLLHNGYKVSLSLFECYYTVLYLLPLASASALGRLRSSHRPSCTCFNILYFLHAVVYWARICELGKKVDWKQERCFCVREDRLSSCSSKREKLFSDQHWSKNAVFYVREDRLSSCSSKREKLFSEYSIEARMLFFTPKRLASCRPKRERDRNVFCIQNGSKNAVFYVREERLSSCSSNNSKRSSVFFISGLMRVLYVLVDIEFYLNVLRLWFQKRDHILHLGVWGGVWDCVLQQRKGYVHYCIIHYVLYLEDRKLVAAGNSAVRKSCAENQTIRTIARISWNRRRPFSQFLLVAKIVATHCLRISQI